MRVHHAIVAACALATVAATAAPASALGPGSTVLVSRPDAEPLPAGAVNDSSLRGPGAVSDTGRWVVFESQADGLLATPSRFRQVFRLDRLTNEVVLVSATPSGAPGGGDSGTATISDDGSVVAYSSSAQDLVAITTPGRDNVFARDLSRPGTQSQLVSRASDGLLRGGEPADQQAFAGQISGDGDYVLFSSWATNLHPEDVDGGVRSVFVRELDPRFPDLFQSTLLVSRSDADVPLTREAIGTSISDDGQVVTFATDAGGLDPGAADANVTYDVYARAVGDGRAGTTALVSRGEGGGDPVGDRGAFDAALSGDGRTVAFQSAATNLTAGDGNGADDVFKRTNVFGGAAGTTELISRQPAVAAAGNDQSTDPAISRDGSTVSFASEASDLLAQPDANGTSDAFARGAGSTTLLTRDPGGAPAAGAPAFGAPETALSGDGSVSVFSWSADALSTIDDNDFQSVYAAGVSGGPVAHLSRPGGSTGPFVGGVNAASPGIAVSADGRFVAFASGADSLAPDDDDALVNAYVRDLLLGRTILVSRASGPSGAAANGGTSGIGISGDGSRVVFSTSATNLSPDDPDDETDLYVRDLVAGTTVLASRADGPAGAKANASTFSGALDFDGSHVVFSTQATNLGAGSDPDTDVFVRDLAAGTTVLVSRADGAAGDQANASANASTISADGQRVAFSTTATNMGDGDADARQDVHVRDLAAGRTILASRADGPDGAKGDGDSSSAQISADGAHVAFETQAANLGDGGGLGRSIYVRDLAASTTRLASRADGAGGTAVSNASFGRVSGDGSRVIWVQFDGSLTGEAPRDAPQTFMRDLAAGRTLLVSRGDGPAGPPLPVVNFATASALSANGRCVAFTAGPDAGFASPQFATTDFLQAYLRTVDGECAVPAAAPPRGGPAPDRTAPAISGLSLSRSRFAVSPRATPARAAASARRGRGRRRARRARNLGTELRFRLSEAASVRIAIARELPGKRLRRRCVRPTRRLRRARRCTRLVARGALVRTRRPAGANRVPFTGRIGRRALARGRYVATLVATDAAGNASRPRTVRFRVVRPR